MNADRVGFDLHRRSVGRDHAFPLRDPDSLFSRQLRIADQRVLEFAGPQRPIGFVAAIRKSFGCHPKARLSENVQHL